MFQKGHTYSIGNKGGRKAKKIEMELAKETITQDALIKLANSKVYKQLIALQDFKDTKEMALPITLKGMIEKIGGDSKNPIRIIIEKEIADKNANPQSKPNSE